VIETFLSTLFRSFSFSFSLSFPFLSPFVPLSLIVGVLLGTGDVAFALTLPVVGFFGARQGIKNC